MKHSYPDIYDLAGDKMPLWWDDYGCPRYREFHPNLSPNIYASEVVLLLIECQECQHQFKVSLNYDIMDAENELVEPFSVRLKNGEEIWYGDPPCHGWGFEGYTTPLGQATNKRCSAGDTMNSVSLAVLEFWGMPERKQPFTNMSRWERRPELEKIFTPEE